ncbi:enoyl-CoA hydratase/isomerase family protein [Haladaptatus salinisoli]|uniref:enoyl-CoA hydratase/isomerase family protein n=1 Tax=Haladaptatus salinisoli TaxID=2884876 RepID=UPI001D0B5708|nr:enoyl-CoA hydratase-related protein [Haladaptatus salinisoli]
MTDLQNAITDSETVKVTVGERVDGVVTVTLSRPAARNALNAQVRDELSRVLATIDQNDTCRVVVLTGDDEAGTFVAGADVTELRERNAIEQREVSKRPRIYERVANLSKPVIARINGHALGGGCELAQACDIRIAAESAKLGQPEINLGIIPGGGGTQRLPRLVGEGQAMRLILSGELINATEAANIGLVDEVHSEDNLDNAVYDLAESIAEKSPVTLEFAKTAIQANSEMELKAGIEYEAELFAQLFATEDKNEGIDAFFEDREPEWQGR